MGAWDGLASPVTPNNDVWSGVASPISQQGNQPVNQNIPQPDQSLPGENMFRQVGLAGRDLAGAVPMAIAGGGDLVNMGINAVSPAINKYAGTNIPQLGMPTDLVQKGLSATGVFPEYQNDTEKGVGTVASMALGGGEEGYNLAKTAGNNLMDMMKSNSGTSPTSSAAAKTISNLFYKQANASDASLTPDFTNNLIDYAKSQAEQTPGGRLTTGDSPLSNLVDRWENGMPNKNISSLRDQPLTMQSVQEMDEGLGRLIDNEYNNGRLSKDGQQLLDVQTNFRNMINDADPSQVTGGAAAFDDLSNARDAWHQGAKMSDIERIMTRADASDNPATVIKTGARTMLSNPSRTRGWSDDELDALKDMSDRGAVGGLLHVAGSRLIPIISTGAGLAGGPLGAAAGGLASYGLSTGARNLAATMQMNKAKNVLGVLGKNVPDFTPDIPFDPLTPNRLQLTYQPTPFVADSNGVVAQPANPQVGAYQFGQQEGMPFQNGERQNIVVQSGDYPNTPLGSQFGQTSFNNAMNQPSTDGKYGGLRALLLKSRNQSYSKYKGGTE